MSPTIHSSLHALHRRWVQMAKTVEHEAVIKAVDEEGGLRASYLFMCVMSAGIAMTGLLINSPAVIIGAMLISPLMAPIVRLGLGVATLDHQRAKGSFGVLLLGMLFALITAFAIVWISPIRDITPEIAARTHPNLFDLLIAVLSGLAGGYGMVRGRGGAIVGVAIATALMPPMVVVGYGIASAQWPVARGALLLFTTNFVAIALSVTSITTWYGFSRRRVRHAVVWQTGLAFLLILPLTLPLWQSLRAITTEAQIARGVRQAVVQTLGADQSRVMTLQVAIGKGDAPTRVDLALAARHYELADDQALRARIADLVAGPLTLRLSPILEADPTHLPLADSALANPVANIVAALPEPVAHPMETLVENFPLALSAHELDIESRRLTLFVATSNLSLAACREVEAQMLKRFSDWNIRVIPPIQALPEIVFEAADDQISAQGASTIELIQWTLKQWGINSVRVFGFASSEGSGNAQLAARRAAAVQAIFAQGGIAADSVIAFPQPEQRLDERNSGRSAYRVVTVTPLSPTVTAIPKSAVGGNTQSFGVESENDNKSDLPVNGIDAGDSSKPGSE